MLSNFFYLQFKSKCISRIRRGRASFSKGFSYLQYSFKFFSNLEKLQTIFFFLIDNIAYPSFRLKRDKYSDDLYSTTLRNLNQKKFANSYAWFFLTQVLGDRPAISKLQNYKHVSLTFVTAELRWKMEQQRIMNSRLTSSLKANEVFNDVYVPRDITSGNNFKPFDQDSQQVEHYGILPFFPSCLRYAIWLPSDWMTHSALNKNRNAGLLWADCIFTLYLYFHLFLNENENWWKARYRPWQTSTGQDSDLHL